MATLEGYPFRLPDSPTGKWVRARHRARAPVLQRRCTGEPEDPQLTPRSMEPSSVFRLLAPGLRYHLLLRMG